MKKGVFRMVLFFGAVAVLFSCISVFTSLRSVSVPTQNGVGDLMGLDLSSQIAAVRPEGMDFYPGVHLAPGQFGGAPSPRTFTGADKSGVQYGTYRLILRLPAGQTYALRAMAVNFAQRLWIDGVEKEAVGRPGETAETTVPAARNIVCVFTPRTDTTEIVLQYANFVYRGGGEAYPFYISQQQNILRGELRLLFRGCMVAGCMLTIFAFYLGMYLFLGRRPYFLAFSVSSLAIAVHGMLVGEKFLTRLWPGVGWYTAMRVEYLSLLVMVAAFLLYLAGMFPGLLHRRGLAAYLLFSAAFASVVLVTAPSVFSWGLLAYQAVSVPYGVYIIVRLVLRLRRDREPENILVLVGGTLFLVGTISESYLHSHAVHTGISGLDQPAMMIFIFANMIALALRYARTERELADLTELDRMKTEFINQASHDLKTPVAVMGLALQRLEDVDEGEREQFLSAARRSHEDMARLVGNLLSVARLDAGGRRYDLQAVPVEDLCAAIQEKYEDALAVRGVELDVSADTRRALRADRNVLWSALDNLVYNALRYTPAGGTIRVAVGEAGAEVSLSVSDTGPGIDPAHLPRIFDRGYTVDEKSSTGMGLYIVKTEVEGMGGTVAAGCAADGGAAFTLVFPAAEG